MKTLVIPGAGLERKSFKRRGGKLARRGPIIASQIQFCHSQQKIFVIEFLGPCYAPLHEGSGLSPVRPKFRRKHRLDLLSVTSKNRRE